MHFISLLGLASFVVHITVIKLRFSHCMVVADIALIMYLTPAPSWELSTLSALTGVENIASRSGVNTMAR